LSQNLAGRIAAGGQGTAAHSVLVWLQGDCAQTDVQGAGVLPVGRLRESALQIGRGRCGLRNLTEQFIGRTRVDGVDSPPDLGPQFLQRERGLPRVGRGNLVSFSNRVA